MVGNNEHLLNGSIGIIDGERLQTRITRFLGWRLQLEETFMVYV
jgi:hypothetical protein